MRWLRLFCVIAPLAAGAAELPPDAQLAAQGWRVLGFESKPHNRYRAIPGGVEVESRSSVSLLYRAVAPDLARTPCLAWRWRVDRAMPPTDLSRKGGDDRPVALYVSFPYVAAEASFAQKLQRVLVELLHGEDAPGQLLVYVWGGTAAAGSVLSSPYLGKSGALIVLRAGEAPLGEWLPERIDLGRDYARVFGRAARTPSQLAIGADSDDTETASLAQVADIRFEACG